MITLMLIIGFAIAITVAFLVYWSNAHWSIKVSVLVALLLTGVMAYENYVNSLGTPILAKPDGQVGYVYHIIGGDPAVITLWAFDTEFRHKLYQYPFTREDAKQLEEAKNRSEQGPPQQLDYESTDGVGGPGLSDFPIPDENFVKD
jgi:hypothetical protein